MTISWHIYVRAFVCVWLYVLPWQSYFVADHLGLTFVILGVVAGFWVFSPMELRSFCFDFEKNMKIQKVSGKSMHAHILTT